jgi:hypothetical protein
MWCDPARDMDAGYDNAPINLIILFTSPRPYPWAFELFEILWSNFPLPGQKSCSNAPHIMEN